jgi:hypothetical protein
MGSNVNFSELNFASFKYLATRVQKIQRKIGLEKPIVIKYNQFVNKATILRYINILGIVAKVPSQLQETTTILCSGSRRSHHHIRFREVTPPYQVQGSHTMISLKNSHR